MRIGFYRVSRQPHMDTILRCSTCLCEREEKQGLIIFHGQPQKVWYLGCECPKPNGVF